MNPDTPTQQKAQELQLLEQNAQSLSIQKQSVQAELNEINNALAELGKASDDAYRILSGIMMKADKASLEKELNEKKKLLELRIQAFEKQEKLISEKAKKLRSDFSQAFNKKK